MKAIRIRNLTSKASIEVAELEQPKRGTPTDVLVRVLCIGLDGTDRELLQEHYGTPPQGETDLTNGHESLGVVVETGEVSGLKPGDLVTALVRRPCHDPHCVNCRSGHADFCQTGAYVERGIKGANGYLAEYYVEDERYLVPVPVESLQYGMLAEPQSIVEKVWSQVQRIQQRMIWEPRTALVLGAGPLGLLAAFTCRTLGLDVHVWSRGSENSLQAQLLQRAGATFVPAPEPAPGVKEKATTAMAGQMPGDQAKMKGLEPGVEGNGSVAMKGLESGVQGNGTEAASSGGPRTLKEYVERAGLQPDLIFECTGYSPLAFEAIDALGPNGVLALLGVTPGKKSLQLPTDQLNQEMVLENKCILGSVNASRKDFETGLYRLRQIESSFPGLLGALITNRLRLEDVPQLDFHRIDIKAVVDVVPQADWQKHVQPSAEPVYSFSV